MYGGGEVRWEGLSTMDYRPPAKVAIGRYREYLVTTTGNENGN